MKKLLSKLPRLSRPARIVRNLVCALVLIVFVWAMLGKPMPEILRLRVMERRAMVGPSEILGSYKLPEEWGYPRPGILVGETEYGICLLPKGERGTVSSLNSMFYFEKTGAVTLLRAPENNGADKTGAPFSTVWMLFSDWKGARAEVDLTLTAKGTSNYVDYDFERTYHLSAEAEEEGFFFLPMLIEKVESLGEQQALGRIENGIWGEYRTQTGDGPIYADVRIYGADDILLAEEHIVLAEGRE